jgi:hypothetical protein
MFKKNKAHQQPALISAIHDLPEKQRKRLGCVSNELDPIIGRLFSVFWALETFVLRVASTQMKVYFPLSVGDQLDS